MTQTPKRCTWQDPPDVRCEELAVVDHIAQDGKMYAQLCTKHHRELDDSQKPPVNVARMLQCLVRAGGGAEKMAKRML